MLAVSSTSRVSACSRRAFVAARLRAARRSPSDMTSQWSSVVWRKPRSPVTGVRSSWDTMLMNSSRTALISARRRCSSRAARRRRSRKKNSSPPPRTAATARRRRAERSGPVSPPSNSDAFWRKIAVQPIADLRSLEEDTVDDDAAAVDEEGAGARSGRLQQLEAAGVAWVVGGQVPGRRRIHRRVALEDLLDRGVELAAELANLRELQPLEGAATVALRLEHRRHDDPGQGEHHEGGADRHPAIASACHACYSTRSGTGRPDTSVSRTTVGSVGKRATNRAPPPSALSTETDALSRSANSLTTARPMPAPRGRCVASVSER